MAKTIDKIRLTQKKIAVVDACDVDWLREWKWHATNCGTKHVNGEKWYAGRCTKKDGKLTRYYMHREIMKRMLAEEGFAHGEILEKMKGMHVDHGDGDGLNNTRENLWLVSPADNSVEWMLSGHIATHLKHKK